MPGTRKMTDAELERALDFLMHQASDDIEKAYEISLTSENGPVALITMLRSIARLASRTANHLDDM